MINFDWNKFLKEVISNPEVFIEEQGGWSSIDKTEEDEELSQPENESDSSFTEQSYDESDSTEESLYEESSVDCDESEIYSESSNN